MDGHIAELITAVSAMLGIAGGILRYVVRIASTIEKATQTADATLTVLREHMAESARTHEQMHAETNRHTVQLAVLETRTTATSRRGATA